MRALRALLAGLNVLVSLVALPRSHAGADPAVEVDGSAARAELLIAPGLAELRGSLGRVAWSRGGSHARLVVETASLEVTDLHAFGALDGWFLGFQYELAR